VPEGRLKKEEGEHVIALVEVEEDAVGEVEEDMLQEIGIVKSKV